MNANYKAQKARIIRELREIAATLPPIQGRRIYNKLDRLTLTEKKAIRAGVDIWGEGETPDQIAARYNARKAIFTAMTEGRRITIRDSREFRVSQMHTQICVIRQRIEEKGLPWVMCSQWVDLSPGKRCKEYWLVPKEGAAV